MEKKHQFGTVGLRNNSLYMRVHGRSQADAAERPHSL